MEYEGDVFPTEDVARVGRWVVQRCLLAGKTVGEDVIGPRGVVRVSLRRKPEAVGGGGSLDLVGGLLRRLNGTERAELMRAVEKAEDVSGLA